MNPSAECEWSASLRMQRLNELQWQLLAHVTLAVQMLRSLVGAPQLVHFCKQLATGA